MIGNPFPARREDAIESFLFHRVERVTKFRQADTQYCSGMAKKQLTPPPKPTDQKGAQPAAPVEQSPSAEPGSGTESRQSEAIPALETPQLSPVPQPPSSQ